MGDTMNEVAKQSAAVSAMQAGWDLIDALLGGTVAMRAAGKAYMPQRLMEEGSDYAERLKCATLLPALAETIETMTGRAFYKPMTDKDLPDFIAAEVWPDIDRQGTSAEVFAQSWFKQGGSFGLSHVLIDSPATVGVKTQADQTAAKLRPYAILLHPSRVLGWLVNDRGEIEQLRVTFQREERGEFDVKMVEQIRVYEFARVRVFEKIKRTDGADEWAQVEDYATAYPGIPLITFYTQRSGFMTADPPLRELAYLNAKHWRQGSGLDDLVETAMVPILAGVGLDDRQQITIGARSAINLPMGCDLKYVEHSGAAIGSGREQLQDLEDQMRKAGAKLLTPTSATKTATQAGDDSARENSQLAGYIRKFEASFAEMLATIARWRGQDEGGTVELQPNLDPDPMPAESMNVLAKMVVTGALSQETLFAEAKRRGMVSDAVQWEDEQARIQAQGPATGTEPQAPPAA